MAGRSAVDAGESAPCHIRARVFSSTLAQAGQKPPKVADTIGWMYELAREKQEDMNYAAAQLTLTMAAIHTTTEGLTQALLDLCVDRRPDEDVHYIMTADMQPAAEDAWQLPVRD